MSEEGVCQNPPKKARRSETRTDRLPKWPSWFTLTWGQQRKAAHIFYCRQVIVNARLELSHMYSIFLIKRSTVDLPGERKAFRRQLTNPLERRMFDRRERITYSQEQKVAVAGAISLGLLPSDVNILFAEFRRLRKHFGKDKYTPFDLT